MTAIPELPPAPRLCQQARPRGPHWHEYLESAARGRWQLLLCELRERGIRPTHLNGMLGQLAVRYCHLWAEYHLANEIMRRRGRTILTWRGRIDGPLIEYQRKALERLRLVGKLIGLRRC